MISTKPYLVRAFYEWILDNGMTPYVVLNTLIPHIQVPTEYIEDDQIVLNLSPTATDHLDITNDHLDFDASFSGRVFQIYAPIKSVVAIYAKENGRGMVFGEDEEEDDDGFPPPDLDPNSGPPTSRKRPGSKPNLRVVK